MHINAFQAVSFLLSTPCAGALRGQICCDDCQTIIVSEIGFTRGAIELAGALGIELKTLEQLFPGLVEFHSSQKQLTQNFDTNILAYYRAVSA